MSDKLCPLCEGDGFVDDTDELTTLRTSLADAEADVQELTELLNAPCSDIAAHKIIHEAAEILRQKCDPAVEIIGLQTKLAANDWVYCKDRLPEKQDVYLITDHAGYVYSAHFIEKHQLFQGTKAIAWMPLPEPAKMEEEK